MSRLTTRSHGRCHDRVAGEILRAELAFLLARHRANRIGRRGRLPGRSFRARPRSAWRCRCIVHRAIVDPSVSGYRRPRSRMPIWSRWPSAAHIRRPAPVRAGQDRDDIGLVKRVAAEARGQAAVWRSAKGRAGAGVAASSSTMRAYAASRRTRRRRAVVDRRLEAQPGASVKGVPSARRGDERRRQSAAGVAR